MALKKAILNFQCVSDTVVSVSSVSVSTVVYVWMINFVH